MKILGTGLTGLVGSRIVELLPQYQFENISRATGVDITNKEQVTTAISASNSPIVLHLAAKTDVDLCELDKPEGVEGEAWRVNVVGAQHIAEACQLSGKKLIFVSTDFVFDGEHTPEDGYTEESVPNPINWYGQTKYEAEKVVQLIGSPWLIMRIAYPYRAVFAKKDFVRVLYNRLREGKQLTMITDHIMTPTFIDDIASALDKLIQTQQTGVYHVTGSQFITPYEIALRLCKDFHLDSSLVEKTTREQYFKDRAKRGFCLRMKNARIVNLGVTMRTLDQGIEEIKYQISNSKNL